MKIKVRRYWNGRNGGFELSSPDKMINGKYVQGVDRHRIPCDGLNWNRATATIALDDLVKLYGFNRSSIRFDVV